MVRKGPTRGAKIMVGVTIGLLTVALIALIFIASYRGFNQRHDMRSGVTTLPAPIVFMDEEPEESAPVMQGRRNAQRLDALEGCGDVILVG